MKENDPLNPVLKEWTAPEPTAELDARVRSNYRAVYRPSVWRRMWSFEVRIPVPVLAGLLILVGVLFYQFRAVAPANQPAVTVPPTTGDYVTRIDAAGFRPLPDGAVRIIRSKGSKQ